MGLYDHGLLFEIGDKVLIKSQNNQEGVVVGWYITHTPSLRLGFSTFSKEYQVRCEFDHWNQDPYYPIGEYLGKRPVFVRIKEEDLTSLAVSVATDNVHLLDALTYISKNSIPIDPYYIIDIAQGSQMDNIALQFGLQRNGDQETDVEFRKRILDYYNYRGFPTFRTLCPEDLPTCDHSWKHYEGFSSNYDYCEKCDQKK